MKYIYNGNIKSISDIVDNINEEQTFQSFPTNNIRKGKLKKELLVISGIFCNANGKIQQDTDSIQIDLKVRLKWQFWFFGFVLIIFLGGFLFGDNVTINGNSNHSIWLRTGFVAIGLGIFTILGLILLKLRCDFEKKVKDLLSLKN